MKAKKVISWLTGLLTFTLAVFSFVLSFNALMALATEHGVSIPGLFPFVVEFGMIVFSLNALYRSLNGENAKWQWTLIIFSSLLAGTFNVAHAEQDLISQAMAAMPSLFLLLSFETFMSQVRYEVTRSASVQNLTDLNKELNDKGKELEQLSNDIEQKRSIVVQLSEQIEKLNRSKKATEIVQFGDIEQANEARLNGKQEKLNQLLNFYRSNPNASLNDAGEAIERSKGTVSNYLNELEEAGLISRNGQGVEVTA